MFSGKISGILSYVFKTIIIISSCTGIILSFYWPTGYMVGWRTFLYFTIQSNVLTAIICTVGIVFQIICEKTGKAIPEWYYAAKHICTLLMIITFFTFYGMLLLAVISPDEQLGYGLLNMAARSSNYTVHLIAPLFTIMDFIYSDRRLTCNRKTVCFCSLIYPLFYVVSTLIFSYSGIVFSENGSIVPYFFLNYQQYGWFDISSAGIGVVYMLIIIGVAYYFLNYLLFAIKRKTPLGLQKAE